MKRIALFLFCLTLFTLCYGKPSIDTYLKDLEEEGYCVIPNILSIAETERLYERVWHEFIEKAWPQCKMEDRSNWKETFPIHQKNAIFAGPAGQTQVMWDLRQDPRIVHIFQEIWNFEELIVSMDGLSFMCPPEIREGSIEPWPHVDQSVLTRQDGVAHNNCPPIDFVSESILKTQPYTIQGQFLFEDSFEGDGGFYCIPKSHLKFPEIAPLLETISKIADRPERKKARSSLLAKFFPEDHTYYKKHVTAPRGSLILWDSRTIHWNQHASKERDEPRVRMVGYLCYVPKARLSKEGKILRKEAFERKVSTGHNPAFVELKHTKDHIHKEFTQYLEDVSYMPPEIVLTPLGKSVLGIEL